MHANCRPAGGTTIAAGTIVQWSGTIAAIPAGWAQCNGSNGTPDLRDKFIIAAQSEDGGVPVTNITGSLEFTGGSTDATHTHDIEDFTDNFVQPAGASAALIPGTAVASEVLTVIPPFYALFYIMKL